MDDEEPSIFPVDHCGRLHADAAPSGSARRTSSVAYFGSAHRVSEGFAIALRAMGIGVGILPDDPATGPTCKTEYQMYMKSCGKKS